MQRIHPLFLAVGLLVGSLGCSSEAVKQPDPDGSTPAGHDGGTPPGACSSLDECACMAASDRCTARAEACWCPSCTPGVVCICGGGKFLGCEDRAVNSCATELARVQAVCAGKSFTQYIGGLCASNADCVATCLGRNIVNVEACAQIDCYFCPVCDCAATPPTPLRTCLAACATR